MTPEELAAIVAEKASQETMKDLAEVSLDNVDFSKKPDHLKALDAQIAAEKIQEAAATKDPLHNLYILTYKGNGPIELVLFRSNRKIPLIDRDCKVWCKARSFRFISFKPAIVNLFSDSEKEQSGPPAGDITSLVTMQSKDPKFRLPEFADRRRVVPTSD
ncbi:MAG: hypothetical protein KGI50_07935 [Patescibacteria group bacterium]|nr:hypothetical protein [Patescibacteria group bacterium]